MASDTGTVTFAGWNIYGYGNLIVINHGNSYRRSMPISVVSASSPVYQGQCYRRDLTRAIIIHFEVLLGQRRIILLVRGRFLREGGQMTAAGGCCFTSIRCLSRSCPQPRLNVNDAGRRWYSSPHNP